MSLNHNEWYEATKTNAYFILFINYLPAVMKMGAFVKKTKQNWSSLYKLSPLIGKGVWVKIVCLDINLVLGGGGGVKLPHELKVGR